MNEPRPSAKQVRTVAGSSRSNKKTKEITQTKWLALFLWLSNMVTHELSVQKIYFPEKGSAALDPETYPGLQQYAGQLVDTPDKAKAYANEYIGKHLEQIAGGKTYSEVSAAAKADPTNATLQQQKAVLFQGETLRGLLLTSGYGFGTIGVIAGIAAFTALGAAALLVCVGYALRR